MTWQEFAQQDPELAALGQERLDRNGLVMVATLRKNGWPRISSVEPLFHIGQLYRGMMWRSRKALDLLRDPRCSIHNAVSDRMASEGEFKVYSRALDITDTEEQQNYLQALLQKIGDQPVGHEFHCFAMDIKSAAANTLIGEEFEHQVWKTRELRSQLPCSAPVAASAANNSREARARKLASIAPTLFSMIVPSELMNTVSAWQSHRTCGGRCRRRSGLPNKSRPTPATTLRHCRGSPDQ